MRSHVRVCLHVTCARISCNVALICLRRDSLRIVESYSISLANSYSFLLTNLYKNAAIQLRAYVLVFGGSG